ncbi:class I SAM-dependent methyltransferase [Desulfonema magnum]|uniref:Methyltransferase domain-containing protein n=1 Tax=Desulfonema magnum TaxID=45655 RepID=A0A975GSZ3_9BACT|nr:class I SAM-dependent methyltransferase [Desulfonema magnum]QTA92457.1 Methyltransferase domain-containing protein [Desulfonema magnum]
MGYIFNYNDAIAYEQWCNEAKNKRATELENRLMLNMLEPVQGSRVLDIGCGTGASLFPFIEKGLLTTGLDPSPDMIDIALKNLGHRADLYRGFAEDLPFDDNFFNQACLVKSLEFVEDPKKAIEEACRVAKDKIFIGVLNRYSIRGTRLRVRRIFTKSLYDHARFFSIWELEEIIRELLGNVPISWRTVCQFSAPTGRISHTIEHSNLVQKCPFGAFTGMTVTLIPRFRTRLLELLRHPASEGGAVAGLARAKELKIEN